MRPNTISALEDYSRILEGIRCIRPPGVRNDPLAEIALDRAENSVLFSKSFGIAVWVNFFRVEEKVWTLVLFR